MYLILEYKQLSKGCYVFTHSACVHFLWVTVTGEIYGEETLGPDIRRSIRIDYEASWVPSIRMERRRMEDSFNYCQQDATLYNILYCCQCSTCFRRFLRPSSGAQNCTHTSSGIRPACLLLPLAWVSSQPR